MNELINFFQDKKVSKVLDVGTGSGNFLAVLKSTFPNAKITGIDPNSEAIKEGSEKFPDVQFIKMGAEDIDFLDGYFDVATISMALHHLPDIEKSLAEMQRVVKSGGWIIVNELFSDNLNPAQKVQKMYHHLGSEIDRILGISHNETFKKDEILRLVTDSGIDIQFHFEFTKEENLISTNGELEERVEKIKVRLESIKEYSEYKLLKPQIEEFRTSAKKFGFQSATRVVVVGKV